MGALVLAIYGGKEFKKYRTEKAVAAKADAEDSETLSERRTENMEEFNLKWEKKVKTSKYGAVILGTMGVPSVLGYTGALSGLGVKAGSTGAALGAVAMPAAAAAGLALLGVGKGGVLSYKRWSKKRNELIKGKGKDSDEYKKFMKNTYMALATLVIGGTATTVWAVAGLTGIGLVLEPALIYGMYKKKEMAMEFWVAARKSCKKKGPFYEKAFLIGTLVIALTFAGGFAYLISLLGPAGVALLGGMAGIKLILKDKEDEKFTVPYIEGKSEMDHRRTQAADIGAAIAVPVLTGTTGYTAMIAYQTTVVSTMKAAATWAASTAVAHPYPLLVVASILYRRLNTDIKKYKFTHVYREVTPNEINLALLSKHYFEVIDLYYANKGENRYILEAIFDDIYGGKDSDSGHQIGVINKYITAAKKGAHEGILFDMTEDITDIIGTKAFTSLSVADNYIDKVESQQSSTSTEPKKSNKDKINDNYKSYWNTKLGGTIESRFTIANEADLQIQLTTYQKSKLGFGQGLYPIEDKYKYQHQRDIQREMHEFNTHISNSRRRHRDIIERLKTQYMKDKSDTSKNKSDNLIKNLKGDNIAEKKNKFLESIGNSKTSGSISYLINDNILKTSGDSDLKLDTNDTSKMGYNYIEFLFYYCILKTINDARTNILNKVYDLTESHPKLFPGFDKLKIKLIAISKKIPFITDYKKWLQDRQLGEFITVLESKRVRGNLSVLESLRLLRESDRKDIYNYVIKGKDPKGLPVNKLNLAIQELNDKHKKKVTKKLKGRKKKRNGLKRKN